MPNEVEVSPIFSTYKEAPLGAFYMIITIGRALSEAISLETIFYEARYVCSKKYIFESN
jgi:hypothetical protein